MLISSKLMKQGRVALFLLSASLCPVLFLNNAYSQQSAQQSVHRQSLSYQGVLTDASGLAVKDGDYDFVATLYSDANGSAALWHDSYHTRVTKGVFNIAIGSGPAPLPSSQVLDKPLYLGITINGASEMRPLRQLSVTAFALNVADSAITAQKMATDYVSSVQINGQQITSRGGSVNFMPGAGIEMRYDSGAQGIIVNTQKIQSGVHNGTSDYWGEGGNHSLPVGSYLGTSDAEDVEIHVNDAAGTTGGTGRVMLYSPQTNSANLIGGYNGNTTTGSGTQGATIGGGGQTGTNTLKSTTPRSSTNQITGSYASILGGYGNVSNNASAVGGGVNNDATGQYAVIGGGENNTSSDYYSTVGGGLLNFASGGVSPDYAEAATIAGGEGNKGFGTRCNDRWRQ
jgi:hypothetical protein